MGKTLQMEAAVLELYFANAASGWVSLGATIASSATAGSLYLDLCSTYPGNAGAAASADVLDYTGYVQVVTSRAWAAWTLTESVSCYITNDNTLDWGERTDGGATQTARWVGVRRAAASTNFDWIAPLASTKSFLADVDAGTDTFAAKGHTFADDDQVVCLTAVSPTLFPAGVTEGTVYYIHSAVASETFELSTTTGGGSPVTVTADGQCRVAEVNPKGIDESDTPQAAASTLKFYES